MESRFPIIGNPVGPGGSGTEEKRLNKEKRTMENRAVNSARTVFDNIGRTNAIGEVAVALKGPLSFGPIITLRKRLPFRFIHEFQRDVQQEKHQQGRKNAM